MTFREMKESPAPRAAVWRVRDHYFPAMSASVRGKLRALPPAGRLAELCQACNTLDGATLSLTFGDTELDSPPLSPIPKRKMPS